MNDIAPHDQRRTSDAAKTTAAIAHRKQAASAGAFGLRHGCSAFQLAVWGAVVVAALLLWVALLDQRPLWDPDEGRYAEIPREMVNSGDWTTPRLNDLVYFEKPPLQYWATAVAYELFGQHHWTARLWSALTGLAGVLLVFYVGKRLFNVRTAFYAAAILASNVLYFSLAHFTTLDMGLSFFLEIVVFAFVLGFRYEATAQERRIWIHLAWAAAGLAILSKGLIGAVLPFGALAIYSLVYRDTTVWMKLSPLTGGALFGVITVPWFVAVAQANPDFVQFFFVHEHFTRFLTTQHHRWQPWWFFGPILLLGTFPWTAPILAGSWRAFRGGASRGFRPLGFLAIWVLVVIVFFSASGSKLVPYILPTFPALALLGARYLDEAPLRLISRLLLVSATIATAVLVAGPYVVRQLAPDKGIRLSSDLNWQFVVIAACWGVGAAAIWWTARRHNRDAAVVALMLAAMTAHQFTLLVAAQISPAKSTLALTQQMKPYLGESTRIYVLQTYPQSLPFYLGRTVTLVDYRGELNFGLIREPHKAVATIPAFRERWSSERDAVAVMKQSLYRELRDSGMPMAVIAQDSARVVVRRP